MKHKWVIIKLANRDETPIIETISGKFYWAEDDWKDGIIYDWFETKKEAEEQAKTWRMCDKLIDDKKYRYIVERGDRI